MKGLTKGLLIFAGIIFVIGIVLCISGVILGASFTDIISKISNGINIESGAEIKSVSEVYTGVENIDIDVNYGEIEIVSGEEFKVEAESTSLNNFSCEMENSTLKISFDKKSYFAINGNNMTKIKLYIPYQASINDFDIEVGACSLTAERLECNDIDITVGAGEVEIKNLVANDCDLDCGVGEIVLTSDIKEKMTIKCGVGNVDIDMLGQKEDFNYEIDCGVGNIEISESSYSSLGKSEVINNNADKDMDIDCGVGNIVISYINE